MGHTRQVTGIVHKPDGSPWEGFQLDFTLTPSAVTTHATLPSATVSATTAADGTFSIDLETGVSYQVTEYTALIRSGSSTRYPKGTTYTIVVPDGDTPISLHDIRAADATPVTPTLLGRLEAAETDAASAVAAVATKADIVDVAAITPAAGEVIVGGAAGPESLSRPSALADLGRAPRVLVIGESILNTDTLNTQLAAAIPGVVIDRRTYGGSQSPLGLLLAATDIKARMQAGNLLTWSDLGHWPSLVSVTRTATTSPTTGRPVYRLDAAGVSQQRIDSFTSDGVTVPATPPARMMYSVLFEPGTLSALRLLVYNSTRAGNIVSENFTAQQVAALGGLPMRCAVSFSASDGVGYAAGDVLRLYIYPDPDSWGSGSIYVTEPMLNAGEFPAPYAATAGTAQAAGAEAWATPAPGTERTLYDLVVLQWGRNDRVGMPFADHARVLAAMIAGAARLGSRVLVCTCPPQARADLSDWDAADLYLASPYLPEARKVARQAGARFYDAVADYTALVAAGTPITDLMRDAYHPTVSGAALGVQRYADQIADALAATVDPPLHPLGDGPIVRLGGEVTSGTWTWTHVDSGTAPLYNVDGLLGGHLPRLRVRALVSSTAGHALTATVRGTVVGLVGIADATSGGEVDVRVDDRAPVRVNLLKAGVTNYPQGYHILGGLADTEHTVTITVVSGQARIVGVVAA